MTFAEYWTVTNNVLWDNHEGIYLWWNVTDTIFYHNDIGWSASAQVYENEDNCADNVWDNNWWSDYSGTGNYEVTGISEDHYPSKSLSLVPAEPFEFEITSTGNTMEFGASALNPSSYSVYIDGALYESSGWDGSNIMINLDGLGVGYHDIRVVIFHVSGHTLTVYTNVTVLPSVMPLILIAITAGAAIVLIVIVVLRRKRGS